jgi:hypothetical protein
MTTTADPLYKPAYKFLNDLLEQLRAEGEITYVEKHKFLGDSAQRTQHARLRSDRFLFRVLEKPEALPAALTLAAAIFEDPMGQAHLDAAKSDKEQKSTFEKSKNWILSLIVTPLVRQYFDKDIDDLEHEDHLSNVIKWWLDGFRAREFLSVAICPVEGLGGTVQEIRFSEDVSLRRMTDEEKTSLFEKASFRYSIYEFMEIKYAVYARARCHFGEPCRARTDADIDKAFQALQMTLHGAVRAPVTIIQHTPWSPSPFHNSGAMAQGPDVWRTHEVVTIADDSSDAITGNFLRLTSRKLAGAHEVRRAVGRLISARTKHDPVDTFLDLVIGLDTLLGQGGPEQTLRISLRCAYLLGSTSGERRTFRNFVQKAYATRSVIAHAGTMPQDAAAALPELEVLLRRAICTVMDLYISGAIESRKGLLEILDERIVS